MRDLEPETEVLSLLTLFVKQNALPTSTTFRELGQSIHTLSHRVLGLPTPCIPYPISQASRPNLPAPLPHTEHTTSS